MVEQVEKIDRNKMLERMRKIYNDYLTEGGVLFTNSKTVINNDKDLRGQIKQCILYFHKHKVCEDISIKDWDNIVKSTTKSKGGEQ